MVAYGRTVLTLLMRGAVAAVIMLTAWQAAAAPRVPTNKDRFTVYVYQKFRAAMPDMPIRAEAPLTLSVRAADGTHSLHLGTPYAECRQDPGGCEQAIDSFVARMKVFYTAPTPPPERDALRVVVRSTPYVEQMREVMANFGGPVAVPLAGDLWVVGVFDLPTTIRMANIKDLEPLGLSADAALALAKQNMIADMRAGIDAALAGRRSGIMLVRGNPYQTSLFGFPELWAPLAAAFHDNLIAALPTSDTLLFGDGTIPGLTAALAEAAREAMKDARRPFSDTVFRWTPSGWQRLADGAPPK